MTETARELAELKRIIDASLAIIRKAKIQGDCARGEKLEAKVAN
jgi:hypothetical protein